ncbi:MAG: cytochrome c [Chloroflexi bacterium]|jgi:mono/diheme cytochrome c family protein|nr:hypothetical protein [Anaerolineae bacterium]MCC6567563.1 cytochrome c [Chloroflexota bacterium]OQY82797.1 MAG: hypothetical protein B6D42_08760 [Anaerolineae bacterium UTCFX5]NOG49172.1 cytochrome c [Chloroflexota bacterium]RIK19910.1 MAG: hypothetical protein DCC53_12150 [Chloroflexota bacterium]
MNNQTIRKTSVWPVVVAGLFLVGFTVLFVSELLQLSGDESSLPPAGETLTAQTYQDVVDVLLVNADVERGAALVQRYGCVACHTGAGADNRLAPNWAGLPDRAAERHPPLSAEAYLYESIVYPRAVDIEGYTGTMPLIYGSQIPDDDLGSIIAYLLTYRGDSD